MCHVLKEEQCRMIDVTDATNRILDLFKQKDVKLNKKKIHDELSDLVNKYGMTQAEADRTIAGKYAKEHNVIIYTASRSNALREINTLKNPNEWVSVEGKVISVAKPETNKIFMKAVFADNTGAIAATLWSRKEGEPMLPEVKVGKWYRLSNVVVNTYNDSPVLSTAKNTTIEEIPEKGNTEAIITEIKDLSTGLFNVRGKIIQFFDSKNDKIDQVGLLGDESGIVKFITWKSSIAAPKLEKDKSYVFNYAQSQKYNELYSLVISSAIEIPDEIHVPSKQTEIIGNLVSIKAGSGLIRRCKVDGCGRVISRQNYCSIHEIQNDFKWDMRIKGIIDDGTTAYNVIITLPTVEKLTGIQLDKAIEISQNNPLGADEVFMRIRSKVLGRYFVVTGTKYPDRVFVQDCNPLEYAKFKEVTGIKPDHAQTSLGV